MARTLLTIEQQHEWLTLNHTRRTLEHKWSIRGMGNSKILDSNGVVLGKANGCGYDRYGAALGRAITELFPEEVLKLAKRECKGRRRTRKQSEEFYGLFYNSVEGIAWLDGACGSRCMERVLNKIGFTLVYVAETNGSQNGSAFYRFEPLTKNQRRYL